MPPDAWGEHCRSACLVRNWSTGWPNARPKEIGRSSCWGGPGVAERGSTAIKRTLPDLRIAGTHAGSPAAEENDDIVQRINASGAAQLFVAYGALNQDKWIERNRINLTTVRVALGVGGSLDFITGRAVRAPQWAQDAGLEWLYRLYKGRGAGGECWPCRGLGGVCWSDNRLRRISNGSPFMHLSQSLSV